VASGAVVRFVRFRCLYRRYTAVGFALIACSVVAWLMQIYTAHGFLVASGRFIYSDTVSAPCCTVWA
jgi:hypothetical protein